MGGKPKNYSRPTVFLSKEMPIFGPFFSLPWQSVAYRHSVAALVLLIIPSILLGIHYIPLPSGENRGFLFALNWSLMYLVILPGIFATMTYLCQRMPLSIEQLCLPKVRVVVHSDAGQQLNYLAFFKNRLSRISRRTWRFALIAALCLTIIDTYDLWLALLTDRYPATVQPDWDNAFRINSPGFVPPSKWANAAFDVVAYSFQGTVVALSLFWICYFWSFLLVFSELLQNKHAPYVFQPMPFDPFRCLGLAPIGVLFNGFLSLLVVFEAFAVYLRLRQISLMRQESISEYLNSVLEGLTVSEFKMSEIGTVWEKLTTPSIYAFDTLAAGPGTLMALIFVTIPVVIIGYFPLGVVRSYVSKAKYTLWETTARDLNDARMNGNKEEAERLESIMEALNKSNIWPNGDRVAYRLLYVILALAIGAWAPPILIFLIVAGLFLEGWRWVYGMLKSEGKTNPE